MILTIKGTDYRVRFGVGFIRELDKKYFVQNQSGVKFGTGLETKIPLLLANDIVTLSEFLYMGTCAEEKRPSQEEIDEYIDSVENIEKLFEEVVQELKKHNATRLKTLELEEAMKKTQETLQKKKK